VSLRTLAVVVKSTDKAAAVQRYSALLETEPLHEFDIAGTELTVTVLPGLSILSGPKAALSTADSLIASALVDSIEATEQELVLAGWTIAGSLGSPNSLLARDVDGSVMEFVEQPN
jgi:hypothetical protein